MVQPLTEYKGHRHYNDNNIGILHNQLESYVEQITLLKTHDSYVVSHMDHIAVWSIDGAPFTMYAVQL